MVKSRVMEVLHLYRCLFVDIGNAIPDLRAELEMDFEKLATLASERGLHLFLVDLPDVGKHLDRCLSEGQFSVTGLPLTKRCPKRVMYPEFLRGLWGLVFGEDGRLKEDCDVEAILFLRQCYYMAKKCKLDCPNEAVLEEVQAFVDTDSQLPHPEEVWYSTASISEAYEGFAKSARYQARLDGHHPCDELSVLLGKLDLVSAFLSTALGDYNPRDWRFRHGPGVVSKAPPGGNKYLFSNWSDALEHVYPLADYGYHSYESWARHRLEVEMGRSDYCGGAIPSSRLIAVPKTLTKPRLIAAEPSEHMWCQQNIWHYMRCRVQGSWIAKFIRFTDQTRNQELCRAASRDGTLATLDLSSASDRVSCHFVGNLFRTNPRLLEALRATRTQSLDQGLHPQLPRSIKLNKFSTMGSACTFPVETIGFLAIVLAACLTQRRRPVTVREIDRLKDEVTIFGDDLVVPNDCRELVCEALSLLDFKVNASKSYWSGYFRESCGVDAYRGVDITPVYWRAFASSKPEEIVSTVEVRNSFYKRGFWTVAEYLTSTIRREGIPRVSISSGVFGLATFVSPRAEGLSRRFNVHYQRDEVYCLQPSCRQQIREINDDSVLLQFFTENPEPHTAWRGGVALRPKVRLTLAWVPIIDVVS